MYAKNLRTQFHNPKFSALRGTKEYVKTNVNLSILYSNQSSSLLSPTTALVRHDICPVPSFLIFDSFEYFIRYLEDYLSDVRVCYSMSLYSIHTKCKVFSYCQ